MTTAKKPVARRRATAGAGQPRRSPVDWEGQEQMVLIRWLYGEKMRGTKVGELFDAIYHPPNGGLRNPREAARFKRQGVKAGVSDLVIRQARGGWHGLYLEFKATPPHHARLSKSQREWLEGSEHEGYCAMLARGHMQAKVVLIEYASWPRTHVTGTRREMSSGTEWRR